MTNKIKTRVCHRHNLSKGFTLVETFVAIIVLMITVLGPMSLLSNALRDSRYIKDQITATYLAQEGVELMIDQRNQGVATFNTSLYSCPSGLKKDNDANSDTYGYNCITGDPTIFAREIILNQLAVAPRQYEIISKVTIIRNNLPIKPIISRSIIFAN
ncbi:MAG: hypothetical protein WC385_02345 [Candidatus Paceibacterota bacterium]|jgi:type II secretory pathway pseudopilin PulG